MPPLVDPVVPPGSLAGTAQPELDGHGLRLRPWRPDDAPVLVAAYADPQIQQWHARWMTRTEAERWIARAAERWDDEAGAEWAVTAGGVVVGRAGLKRVGLAEGSGEVTYWVAPQSRRRGVASGALDVLSDWAFHDLGLHRLELLHSVRNLASCGVARRAGFAIEGTKREEALHVDGWHDMHLHARLTERSG